MNLTHSPLLLAATLWAAGSLGAHAAVFALEDKFTKDTTANYHGSNGYTVSYVSKCATDFGDGANEGALWVVVKPKNKTGLLSHSLASIEKSDVGKRLTLTFRVTSKNQNYHLADVSFTLNDAPIDSTTISTSTFTLWSEAATAPDASSVTLKEWRANHGEGTITYTITEADVGKNLGWQFAATATSPSEAGFSFGIDYWNLSVSK